MAQTRKSPSGKQAAGAIILGLFVVIGFYIFTAGAFLASLPMALGSGGVTIVILLGGAQLGGDMIGGLIDAWLSAIAEFFGAILSGIGDLFGGLG